MGNQRDPDSIRQVVFSILAGAAGGILMAILILFMTRTAGFSLWTLSFWLILTAACWLPVCMDYFCRFDLLAGPMELAMIAVSLVIALLYARQAAGDAATQSRMIAQAVILHASALAVSLIRIIRRRQKRKGYGK